MSAIGRQLTEREVDAHMRTARGRIRSLPADGGGSLKRDSALMGLDRKVLMCRQAKAPSFTTLLRIAEYYGVSVDWLMGRTERREVLR